MSETKISHKEEFQIGDRVTVSATGHRQDGRTGTISYFGSFFGTVGVSIDGHDFGFLPNELTAAKRAGNE